MQGHALDGIVSVVVVKVGFDVLRVVNVAVVALAIVLPNQFPVGMNVEVHDLSHFGAGQSLWAGDRADRGGNRLKVQGLRRKS